MLSQIPPWAPGNLGVTLGRDPAAPAGLCSMGSTSSVLLVNWPSESFHCCPILCDVLNSGSSCSGVLWNLSGS